MRPPRIGSTEWDDELATIGVSRRQVDAALPAERKAVDPHSLSFSGDALEAAALVLLHEDVPSYATLMYVRHRFNSGDDRLKTWITRQYAAMLEHGDETIVASASYALWVDPFEVDADARFVFPRLFADVGPRARAALVAASGPLPWDLKRDAYTWAVEHAPQALAKGLVGSFYDVLGQVDAAEARRLFHRLEVDEDELRKALHDATSGPFRAWISAVTVFADSAGSFLVHAEARSSFRRWKIGSELVLGETAFGVLVHVSPPFDKTAAHETFTASINGLAGEPVLTLKIEGDPKTAPRLVGQDVELWPRGLRAALLS